MRKQNWPKRLAAYVGDMVGSRTAAALD
jgi:hypothetical protein